MSTNQQTMSNKEYPVPRNSSRQKAGSPAKIAATAAVGGLLGIPLGPAGIVLGTTTGALAGKAISEKHGNKPEDKTKKHERNKDERK